MCDSLIDRIMVTSQLLRQLTSGDAVNVVVGNSTLTGCPYLLPVSAMTTQRLITSLFRLLPSAPRHYHLGSDVTQYTASLALASSDSFSARQHTCYSALYAIARPSVPLSVCLSVTRVDQSKTVEVRITQPSPQSSPMTLVS